MGYTSKSQGIWRGLESGGQWPPSVFDKVFEVAMNFFLLSFPRNWVKYEILSIYLFTTPRLWRCKWKKITSRAPNNENRQWLMVIWEWESHQPRILMLSFRLWRFTNHLLTYLLTCPATVHWHRYEQWSGLCHHMHFYNPRKEHPCAEPHLKFQALKCMQASWL